MTTVESAILKELTGSETVGQFPDTAVDGMWDVWAFLSRLCEAQNKSAPKLGATSTGGPVPLPADASPLQVSLGQLTGSFRPGEHPGWAPSSETARARWDQRYRTLSDLVDECEGMVAVLSNRPVTTPPASTPTPAPVQYPAPKNLIAVANADGSISLDWDDVADAVSYKPYEKASPQGLASVTESQSRRGPFTDYREYEYWIVAEFPGGKVSAPSEHVKVTLKAPVAVSPARTLPPGTAQGSLTWRGNLAGTLIKAGNFKATSWNTENGGSWPPPVVDAPGGRGGKAIQFKLPSNGKRIEVEPDHKTFGAQGDAWFGFATYFDDSFPLSADTWQVIWQLHGNDQISPVFDIQARNNQLRVGDNQVLTSVSKKVWYNIVVHADFTNGVQRVWVNGKDCGSKTVGHSKPDYYLKAGYYHDHDAPGGTIYSTDWALGTGYGAVDPTPV